MLKETYTIDDFDYALPAELIAQQPLPQRAASRLLALNTTTGDIQHRQFSHMLELIQPNDLLVLNDTKVIPARLFGVKESGGKIECLIERVVDEFHVLAHVRASKSPRAGTQLILEEAFNVEVQGREGELFKLKFPQPALDLLQQHGRIPLPPYIERQADEMDKERYQTVFARQPGAVAAPTASLHFDETMLIRLQQRGVQIEYLTLHVGAGTFQPVRVENIEEHHMHSEYFQVSQQLCDAIAATRTRGGRVVAVGTTVVRALEAVAAQGSMQAYTGDTQLFIRPGFQFRCVDALLTNFHLPKSTLLMLVSAFGGYQHVMQAYRAAVTLKYRFFSYGDAMWLASRLA